jgi:ketosteroid isomerase-like protein
VSETVDDAVERQVRAYNAHDLDEFIACYAEEAVVEGADGRVVMSGREEMREQYGRLFDELPTSGPRSSRESAWARTSSTRNASAAGRTASSTSSRSIGWTATD